MVASQYDPTRIPEPMTPGCVPDSGWPAPAPGQTGARHALGTEIDADGEGQLGQRHRTREAPSSIPGLHHGHAYEDNRSSRQCIGEGLFAASFEDDDDGGGAPGAHSLDVTDGWCERWPISAHVCGPQADPDHHRED